jgi:glycosyltransferase involved in cell wall biosynthesis
MNEGIKLASIQKMTISIVIPVFNNAQSIPILWSELNNEFDKFPDLIFEVVFVNDGSTDASIEAIESLKNSQNARIVLIELTRNFGQLSALKAGYENLSGDAVVTISADLQDPTSIVGEFIRHWLSGEKLVLGLRESRQDGFIMSLTSKIAYSILSMDNKKIPMGGFDIFLAGSEIISKINSMPGRFTFLQGDVLSIGYDFKTVPYVRKNRVYGESGYTLRKRLQNFLVAFFDSSYRPIRLLTGLGNLFAFGGFLLALYLVFQRFQPNSPFSGLTLLAAMILIIAGMQMIFLSVIAQYVWRVYDLLRNRPSYVVEKISRNEKF